MAQWRSSSTRFTTPRRAASRARRRVNQPATQPQGSPAATPDYGLRGDGADADPSRFNQVDWSGFNRKYPDLPPRPDDHSFGELKPVTYAPSQRIGNAVADMLMAAGMQPYTANDLTSRVGNVVMASPLGVPGAAADALYAKSRGDDVGTLLAMAGMLPGAGPEIRAASGEIRSGINGARQASGLFDLSRLHEVPNVRQFDLPRYAPPRGVPARVLDVTSDSQFRKKMFGVIEQGRGMGGVSWYNTEPLRDKFVAEA